MDIAKKQELKRFVNELKLIRGRHTELVSVYIPAGYDLNKIIGHLQEEQGTAKNIKDAKTRGNVIDSLERCVRHLRLFKKTPVNGLAVFAGNVAAQEGKVDIKIWSIEPPEPLPMRLYRCDQRFVLDILEEMLEHKEVYGLILIDRREATLGLLKGSSITLLTDLTSGVPGKFKAGGQCHTFGTLVQCSDGAIMRIENLHNPLEVKSADFTTNTLRDSSITDAWYVDKNKVYKIITKYPQMVVQCSGEHLLFVNTSEGIIEKPVAQLRKNDQLLMPERISIQGKKQSLESEKYYNSFILSKDGQNLLKEKRLQLNLYQRVLAKKLGLTQTTISSYEIGKLHANRESLRKVCEAFTIDFYEFLLQYTRPYKYKDVKLPKAVDKHLAQFIGYLIGDGCIEKDRITFFEQNRAVALAYKKRYGMYFKLRSSYKYRIAKNYHQLRFTSKPLVRLVLNEFPEVKKTLNSEVPLKIMRSDDEVVAGFLRGYFDAEGYINPGHSVGIASIDRILIYQVQMLLLRFSILSSIFVYNNKRNPYSKRPIFKLQINDKESLRYFKSYIGFTSTLKSKRLDKLLRFKTEKNMVRQILAFGTDVRKLVSQEGLNLQQFPKVTNFFRNERLMSKYVFKESILKNVLNRELYKKLKGIYDCELLPVAIQRIEVLKGKTPMIDISVQNKNFIANGIISHNSAQRFERLIHGMAIEFFKKVADLCNKEFLPLKNLKGILLGGPGPTKEEFQEYLNNELKKKILAVQDITYTDESGLHHLVEKSADILEKEAIIEEKKLMEKFFTLLAKEPEKAAYGEQEVRRVLALGAVDMLLISENYDDRKMQEFEDLVKASGATLTIISIDTQEGQQLRDLGGIAAILRYAVNHHE